VLRYFHGFSRGLHLKRWRCPDCGAVHTIRPVRYAPGVHYPKDVQNRCLLKKLKSGVFDSAVSRQVQQHWMRIFKHLARRHGNWNDLLACLKSHLPDRQFLVTNRRTYCESIGMIGRPYLPFAVTCKQRPISLE